MSDTLNKKEVDQLMDLFNKIKLDLSDTSCGNFPTRTNRLEAVENMKKVLNIHGYDIKDMPAPEPTKFADARDHHEIMQKGIVR